MMTTICSALADNICVFKVDALSDDSANGQITRKLKLRLIQNIAGAKQNSFELNVIGKKENPLPGLSDEPLNSLWFYGSLVGETVFVSYRGSIEKPDALIIGEKYVHDVTFVVLNSKGPDLATRRQKLDQYLAGVSAVHHSYLANYIAQVVMEAGYSDDVWAAYVKGNPLNLKDSVQGEFFNTLSDMVLDRTDENGKSVRDQTVLKAQTNRWLSEFAAQMNGPTYTDPRAKSESLRLLASVYRKSGENVTQATKAEVERMLLRDGISDKQRALFK